MQNETIRQGGADESGARHTREPDSKDGIFGTWVTLWVGMIESTVRTTSRVSRAVLGEAKSAGNATIGFVEHGTQAMFRASRAVNDGGFGLADEAFSRVERAALVVLRQTQAAGDRASELAAATSQAVVGSRGMNGATAH